MPYKTVKVKGGVRVKNAKTGVVHAKATTPAKAQMNLLRGVEHEYDAVAILLIDEGNMALAERIPDRQQRRQFLEGLMRKRQRMAHA